MMQQKSQLITGYSQEPEASSIEMDYAGGKLSFIVILPTDPQGLPNLENKMTPENLQPLLNSVHKQEVMLSLPKFKLEYNADLGEQLKQLGMSNAFTRGLADFSGIDGTRNIYMSKVVHK